MNRHIALPWHTLLAYGSQAFPLAAAFIALQVIVPTHYAESTALSLSAIGLLLLVARLVDTFSDPLIGYWSDQSRAPLGKRKTFVVAAAPAIAISVWYLFTPPPDAGAAYLLGWTIAIYVAGTVSIVPMSAWGAELSADYNTRARVAGTRVAFGLLGTMAALLVPAVLTDGAEDLSATLDVIVTLVVVTLLLATLWAGIVVPDSSDTVLPENPLPAAWQLLREANPFRQLLVSFLLNAVGNAIPATLFLLFVTHVLEAPDKAGPLLFLYFICAALSVPIWVRLATRFGKHQVWSAAILVACLFFIGAPFLDADKFAWFVLIVAITGFATGADLSLPSAINGDIIEWDALRTGYRRPGLFFSLWGTATKLSYALAIGIAFPLLELLGFSATGENSDQAIRSLAILYGAPCILFKLAALWAMHGYPITSAVHAEIRRQLADKGISGDR